MHRSRLLAPSVLLALVLAACGGGDATPEEPAPSAATSEAAAPSVAASEAAAPSQAASDDVGVTLDGFAFDPTELTISAGTEVTFLNADSAAHTVTEGVDGEAADSPIIDDEVAANQSTSVTFDEAGTYEITCLFHTTMNMTITVEG